MEVRGCPNVGLTVLGVPFIGHIFFANDVVKGSDATEIAILRLRGFGWIWANFRQLLRILTLKIVI